MIFIIWVVGALLASKFLFPLVLENVAYCGDEPDGFEISFSIFCTLVVSSIWFIIVLVILLYKFWLKP